MAADDSASGPPDGYVEATDLQTLEADGAAVAAADGTPIALFLHDGEVHAVDNACPHMGFPLIEGSVDDGILTCHWHHARFELSCGDTFDPWADDVASYPTKIEDGRVFVRPEPASDLPPEERWRNRLETGLEENLRLVIAKSVIGLDDAGVPETEPLERGLEFGATYRESGWSSGLTILAAMGNVLPTLSGHDSRRALYTGLRHVASDCAGEPPNFSQPAFDADVEPDRLVRWFRDAVEVRDDTAALDLIRHEGRVHGAMLESEGDYAPVYAGATVLATGGIGDLFPHSTNPDGSTGDGIAMAALAGADVSDMEFVQFHPTAFASDDPADSFLVSEAVRGEGALLRNADGERFMPEYHDDAELAPRDVVARAVARERDATGEVTLDVSDIDFAAEFPDLVEKCEDRGVDWENGISVVPAEHFLCGGVDVDDRGRTSLDRLYAVGECARTGVHGANRLASTSLLEGLVWGLRAGADAAGNDPEVIEAPDLLERDPDLPDDFARQKFLRLRRVTEEYVGLERDPEDLNRALAVLRRLKGEVDAYVRTRTSRSLYELRNATVTALLVTRHALENTESVGTHYVESSGDATDAQTQQADD